MKREEGFSYPVLISCGRRSLRPFTLLPGRPGLLPVCLPPSLSQGVTLNRVLKKNSSWRIFKWGHNKNSNHLPPPSSNLPNFSQSPCLHCQRTSVCVGWGRGGQQHCNLRPCFLLMPEWEFTFQQPRKWCGWSRPLIRSASLQQQATFKGKCKCVCWQQEGDVDTTTLTSRHKHFEEFQSECGLQKQSLSPSCLHSKSDATNRISKINLSLKPSFIYHICM